MLGPPLPTSRNLTVPEPLDPSSAIQYFAPAEIGVDEIVVLFQAPAFGVEIVLCASRDPGLLDPLSAYRPTATCEAVFPVSTYRYTVLAVPVVVAVYWNASPDPARLLSAPASIFWSPTSNVGAGVAIANVKFGE